MPILGNSFQAHMGIQFHSLGVRRRFVEILHFLPVSLSYDCILQYQKQIASIAESSESVSQHDAKVHFRIPIVKLQITSRIQHLVDSIDCLV